MAKTSTIIAVDVGNTSCLFAEISNGRIRKTHRARTEGAKAERGAKGLKNRFCLKKAEAVVIASVVPRLGLAFKKHIQAVTGIPTFLIGKDMKIPASNRTRHPQQVGIDRLVNAVAAYRKHRRACIIIDFGTAVTLDAVSKKGDYLGGVIAPGIEISLEALFRKTALLPRIRLRHPKETIGRDTVESIRIGCSVGIGGLCDRLALTIKEALGPKSLVIATGGYAKFMKRYCRTIDRVDPELTLRGIWLVYTAALK